MKIIFQGRFLTDDKALKDCGFSEGETVSMHLIIKAIANAKDAGSAGVPDSAAQKCSCLVS